MDEVIRKSILEVLYEAYRKPKGRLHRVTFPLLVRLVKDKVQCEREDVRRELSNLQKKKLIEEKKEKYHAYGSAKPIPGYSISYELSGSGIDIFERPTKYDSMTPMFGFNHKIRVLSITDNFKSSNDYYGVFQPKMCFLPKDADVKVGDKLQFIEAEKVLDEKIAGEVDKYLGVGMGTDHIEVKWRNVGSQGMPSGNVHIENSHIYAPVTMGNQNTITANLTYNTKTDIDKIQEMIQQQLSLSEETRSKLKELISQDLPPILENPNKEQTGGLISKITGIGQTWLVPIITQLVAAYFQHQLKF